MRMDLPQAFLLAALAHGMLLWLGAARPDLLSWDLAVPPRPPDPGPLRFEFVDLPEEPPEPERPPADAPASDRTRRAASRSPAEPAPESRDPRSQGDTSEKVERAPSPESRPRPGEPGGESGGEASPERGGTPEAGVPADSGVARKAQALVDAARPYSLRELGQRYDNPAAPATADFGPISFDTVGVDWGPYARTIVQIIRRNWIDRMPPAFHAGLRGRSVLSFRIGTDGRVSGIALVDGSGIRPFDKAAEFAIEASDPLPPPPEEFQALGKDDVGVTFEFYYNLRPPPR
jgi:TonB family protein